MAVSQYLVDINSCIPVDFARKTRTLEELARFKATELRLLLLYVLPIALINFPPEIYDHFLLLHCAIRILSCPDSVKVKKNVEYAGKLLRLFVESCSELYGDQFISFNLHLLIHLPKLVYLFGPLDFFSCFKFENHLQKLTNLVRPCRSALPQLANRLMEKRLNATDLPKRIPSSSELKLLGEHHNGPIIPPHFGDQFEAAVYSECRLKVSPSNNCFVELVNGDLFKIENFVRLENQVLIVGRKFLENESLFQEPTDSKKIGISIVSRLSNHMDFWPIEYVRHKALEIPLPKKNDCNHDEKFGFINILHYAEIAIN